MYHFEDDDLDDEPLRINIRELNQHVVCILCAGYFIDATTIIECLHTFCKSCIVKYLQTSKQCPMCNIKIHETQPLLNLRPDRTMQDIIFKLIPGLFEGEEQRKKQFYKSRGLDKVQSKVQQKSFSGKLDPTGGHYYRNDEQLSLCLELMESESVNQKEDIQAESILVKKFIRCSVRTCVYHLQKLLMKKLHIPETMMVRIFCDGEQLHEDEPMKLVWLTHWCEKAAPMVLHYKPVPFEKSLKTKDGKVS
ncbi:polycomb group RING finger protein 1-like [Apostichopus japonicus]|uniref:polycomb group RING finger protein 1-like n=1 Tax=Stichopus japonicus TaxID=307972 RepID=UPI003AB3236D